MCRLRGRSFHFCQYVNFAIILASVCTHTEIHVVTRISSWHASCGHSAQQHQKRAQQLLSGNESETDRERARARVPEAFAPKLSKIKSKPAKYTISHCDTFVWLCTFCYACVYLNVLVYVCTCLIRIVRPMLLAIFDALPLT